MITVLLGLLLSLSSYAGSLNCQDLLSTQTDKVQSARPFVLSDYFEIIGSGYDTDTIPVYREVGMELYKPGGVLEQLRIQKTPQVIEFLHGQDLNTVTGHGFPVGHYLDGSHVMRAYGPKSGYALEIVMPGEKVHYALYRDDNPVEKQISIILHVIGHNSFATWSGLTGYRGAQAIYESQDLDRYLTDLYQTENKDEVQRWYLFLQSLIPLQDFYTAYWQTPSEFEPRKAGQTSWTMADEAERRTGIPVKHPLMATENVSQAFVGNIPDHAAPWKRELAERVIRLGSFQTALVHTQVMNEGWASLLQELLIKHLPKNNTFEHWVSAMHVMEHQKTPKLKDPYWLGVEAWRILYSKFKARPEIKALPTEIERDAEFMDYAQDIIKRMTDYSFLPMALDQTWVDSFKLASVKSDRDYQGPMPPQPPPQPGQEPPNLAPWEIVSRDKDVVVADIVEDVVYGKIKYRPRVQLRDFTRKGSGEVELVIDDAVGNQFPLDMSTAGPALYTFAQILEKPVSLNAILSAKIEYPERRTWWDPPAKPKITLVRGRIVVAPNGQVKLFKIVDGKEVEDEENTKLQARVVQDYLADLYLEDDLQLRRILADNPQIEKLVANKTADVMNTITASLFEHIPQASKALLELKNMLERRMYKSFLRAQAGHGGLLLGSKIYLKALPSVPTIGFDFQMLQMILEANQDRRVPTDLNPQIITAQKQKSIFAQTFGKAAPIDGNPGDHVWGPGPPSGDGEPRDPGEDPSDLSWVEMPRDLYAQFLGEKLKLPNLNPKPGKDTRRKPISRGSKHYRTGRRIISDTTIEALKNGLAIEAGNGNDAPDILDALDEGFKVFDLGRDNVVKSKRTKPTPDDVNAVVTFVMDGSGSAARHWDSYKKIVFQIKTVLESNYKSVKFHFVTFDVEAHEVNENEFYRGKLGGGTHYVAGVNKVKEIQDTKYPRVKWDRFSFFFGDLEDNASTTAQAWEELIEQSEYVGVAWGSSWNMNPLLDIVRGISQSSKYLGLLELGPRTEVTIDDLRTLLKNDPE